MPSLLPEAPRLVVALRQLFETKRALRWFGETLPKPPGIALLI